MAKIFVCGVVGLLPLACSSGGDSSAASGVEGPVAVDEPAGAAGSDPGLSDEFNDASTMSQWRRWDQVAGREALHDVLDISTTNDGMLTLQPRTSGWYDHFEGPLLYKMVQGDFLAETFVAATSRTTPGAIPSEQFNSAGMLVRDPTHGRGHDNWVMVNTGRQRGDLIASEGKTTVDSRSDLQLFDGANRGRLRLCRVGTAVVVARQLEGETEFTVTNRFDRPDLPAQVQVGLVANGWNTSDPEPDLSRTPDLEATFDYIRFSVPASETDCIAP